MNNYSTKDYWKTSAAIAWIACNDAEYCKMLYDVNRIKALDQLKTPEDLEKLARYYFWYLAGQKGIDNLFGLFSDSQIAGAWEQVRGKVPVYICPECGASFEGAFNEKLQKIQPPAHAVGVCTYCTAFVRYEENYKLIALTDKQVADLPHEYRMLLVAARQALESGYHFEA